MTTTNKNPLMNNGNISREDLLTIIQVGLNNKEYKFIRQVVLTWLAAYPGDLLFNYFYAKTLVEDGKAAQAIPIIEMLETSDPEYAPAYELHQKALSQMNSKDSQVIASYYALTGRRLDGISLPLWCTLYRQGKEAFDQEKLEDAEMLIQQSLIADPTRILPAVFHIQLVSLLHDAQTVETLSNLYHSRWVDCLYFSYYLAEAFMVSGNDSEAVSLLHQCVSRDSSTPGCGTNLGRD